MASGDIPEEERSEFNVTAASTLQHLISAGLACLGLWVIIALTFGAS